MLPSLVFTINHFNPPAAVISAIGDKDCPSLSDSITRDDSSGAIKTSTTVCSGDACKLEAAHASGRAIIESVTRNMKIKPSGKVIGQGSLLRALHRSHSRTANLVDNDLAAL